MCCCRMSPWCCAALHPPPHPTVYTVLAMTATPLPPPPHMPQADSTDRDFKGLDVLLADESMVLILDDTEQVWDKHRANLIQVRAVLPCVLLVQ